MAIESTIDDDEIAYLETKIVSLFGLPGDADISEGTATVFESETALRFSKSVVTAELDSEPLGAAR